MVVPLLATSLAYTQPTAIIRGRVVNGTFNNRPVAGESVQLFRMSKENPSIVASAQTGRNGEFALRAQDDGTYLILVPYRGVEYTSGPFRANASVPIAPHVVVYEPTTDRPAIHSPYRIVIMDRLGVGVISFTEIASITNQSSRTYLGKEVAPDRRVTFGLGIPKEARGVTVLRGMASPILEQGRLIDASPLQPGVREIAFAYQVPYSGTKATLRWTLEENTGSMDVVVPDQGTAITSSVLETKPPGVIRGQRFLRVARSDLPKGQVIEVALAGLPGYYAPVVPWLAALLALILTATLVTSLQTAKARATLRQSG